jgi:hypothetical protein
MKTVLKITLFAVVVLLAAPVAHTGGLFGVMPDQYSRVLQLMKAKGLFSSYNHSCEMQSDGTGYRCADHLDTIIVVYRHRLIRLL